MALLQIARQGGAQHPADGALTTTTSSSSSGGGSSSILATIVAAIAAARNPARETIGTNLKWLSNFERQEHRVVKLELSQGEREVYARIEENIASKLAGNASAAEARSGKRGRGGAARAGREAEGAEAEGLMQLRLACAHPQLTGFWLSLQAEGQVVGGDGGGMSLSMKEILERMMTMAQQDMEKHERELCRQLTHLSLVTLQMEKFVSARGTAGVVGAGRRLIRFADEDSEAAAGREDRVSCTQGTSGSADGGDSGTGRSTEEAHSSTASPSVGASARAVALEILTKAVRVADDGIQVLGNAGTKQSNLQTSAGALKSWRMVELGLYRTLVQIYTQLADECQPGTEGYCVVCSEAEKAPVCHEIAKRPSCAEKKLQVRFSN